MNSLKYKILTGMVAVVVAGIATGYEKFGDRLPSSITNLIDGVSQTSQATRTTETADAYPYATGTEVIGRGPKVSYDRHLYDHWIDVDGDCQNARHELLQELSTSAVTMNKSGCTVGTGRWNDPYTGNVYTKSRDLDIDHMVPLYWAHQHGGHSWDRETRRKFANDPVNLFAVQASANRQKGAKGPLEWLPPNEGYHCQYITRFHRIVLTYKLSYSPAEKQQMDALRAKLCN